MLIDLTVAVKVDPHRPVMHITGCIFLEWLRGEQKKARPGYGRTWMRLIDGSVTDPENQR